MRFNRWAKNGTIQRIVEALQSLNIKVLPDGNGALKKGNGIEIDFTEFELFSMFLKLAASEVTFDDLVSWLKNHEATRN